MKRILITILFCLLFAFSAFADGTVVQTGGGFQSFGQKGSVHMKTATFTITAAAGSVPNTAFLDVNRSSIYGWYLFSVEMYSATDDTFSPTITTALGTPLFSYTTVSATTGQIINADDRWPIYSIPLIDVADLGGSGVCTIIVTFVR
jgi:hypothetical protein